EPVVDAPRADDVPAATIAAAVDRDPSKLDSMYGPAEPGEIDASAAVALAAEHRLIIRVTMPDNRIDRVTDRLASSRRPGWQYAGEAPTALASAADPESGRVPSNPIERPRTNEYASERTNTNTINLNEYGPPAPQVDLPKPVATVYMVNTRMDEASLDGVCTTL